ncbi:CDP-diacylglycerol--glycerol-3-phosphate 3-phosphatidyltransferase [Salinibacterium sp. NSLL150]|uniref:CDP-diacylglycerol--glycerol-3-phosphate 3-phosphatidyltransferase n=1 Tax=unclassified Salinibacterium TaxID=2632331 RepID=UPI0018CF7A64|nr:MULTISPECIES: CDP-diacylglycerol--glycerol-3-phosphate 3-phosphatidyltransferase [unclassified Salinibacterium]MBH0025321.1 CDP-diacylglycerol--glycerol-3-phosphate 3-phosphatidyltransferase [Salinibacterium sp. SWN248]MBH0100076.1 CDP-diacylglycerol--glycerol-3-phosphate 3-phosphatidyltransferase [Salinibacterium sp. NSLL35]MBH0102830.1 CDP-diacylglycerol--glycerol-3-phosphate 3-phosphatidyltransferase [Salinibacterium sp. NSLL150]MBH0105590.1 CDP-diacylglycerol--glycerol-3-phosphate 3-phos
MVRKGDSPASNANIANIVTVVRIFLAPLFIWMLLLDDGEMGLIRYMAAALFIFAIVTDTVDGHLARGRNLITNVGIILDPIADKILTGGALVALSILGELPWWITILILVREFGITIYRFAVLSKVVVPASRGGKLKTVLQAVAISLFLVPLFTVLGPWVLWVNWFVMAIAFILTMYTGIEYLWQAWRHTRKSNSGA